MAHVQALNGCSTMCVKVGEWAQSGSFLITLCHRSFLYPRPCGDQLTGAGRVTGSSPYTAPRAHDHHIHISSCPRSPYIYIAPRAHDHHTHLIVHTFTTHISSCTRSPYTTHRAHDHHTQLIVHTITIHIPSCTRSPYTSHRAHDHHTQLLVHTRRIELNVSWH